MADDIQAVMWLARELSGKDKDAAWAHRIVIVVSHDRYFLDEVREIGHQCNITQSQQLVCMRICVCVCVPIQESNAPKIVLSFTLF